MLAVLTHHLCAPFIPLDVDLALGAAFDGRVVLLQLESGAAEGEAASGLCSEGQRARRHLPAQVNPGSTSSTRGTEVPCEIC